MSRAKARYDGATQWKYRTYTTQEWDDLNAVVRKKLRPFHPPVSSEKLLEHRAFVSGYDGDGDAAANAHPADAWASSLLSEADRAVSMMLHLKRRLTKAELIAERDDLLKRLKITAKYLNTTAHTERRRPAVEKLYERLCNLSVDFDVHHLGVEPLPEECKDLAKKWLDGERRVDLLEVIGKMIVVAEGAKQSIRQLPKSMLTAQAQHAAVVEMAICILRDLKSDGFSVPTSGNSYFDYTPNVVKILQALGTALGLRLSALTWRDIIAKAKKAAPI